MLPIGILTNGQAKRRASMSDGAVVVCSDVDVMEALARFHQQYGKVEVRIGLSGHEGCLCRLQAGFDLRECQIDDLRRFFEEQTGVVVAEPLFH